MNIFTDQALPFVLIFEGKYTDDPADRGGATNEGITQSEYDAYRTEKQLPIQDVKNITDSEVSDIYYTKYWLTSKCDQMQGNLPIIVFDTAVNNGVGRAAKILQRALNLADVDGIIGPATLAALDAADHDSLVRRYADIRATFYHAIVDHDPTQQKFLNGWLRRLNLVTAYMMGTMTLDEVRKAW